MNITAGIIGTATVAILTDAQLATAVAEAQTIRAALSEVLGRTQGGPAKDALYMAYDNNTALLRTLQDDELRRKSAALAAERAELGE